MNVTEERDWPAIARRIYGEYAEMHARASSLAAKVNALRMLLAASEARCDHLERRVLELTDGTR